MTFGPTPDPSTVTVVDPDGIDECVLAAGCVEDLPEIRDWLRRLPPSVHGRVFIEVSREADVESLPLPPHVGATWLFGGTSGRPAPRGRALAAAVDAWAEEWLRVAGGVDRCFHIWIGANDSDEMRDYWSRLQRELDARWPSPAEVPSPVD
ncbi:SIP domain-containing protein [Leucobacter sp. CSA1]|uniref:SIP domain-containing protein n=1 Tax=Leucobacter chromiisoli TaxID=2796471 RepID=A0A934UWC9_9MICO|nr:SIP domain-containing protein [Leucobacter chromiisoli]MBK0420138.1 SIP domain-containing protein [Leucobacter chromiisoli]